jgi:hypothetical protein
MTARGLAIAASLVAVVQTPPAQRANVRVLVAQVTARSEARDTSPALGVLRYGEVLPLISHEGAWDHVLVFMNSLRVDVFVPVAAIGPAGSAAVDATLFSVGPAIAGKAPAERRIAVAADTAGKTVWLTSAETRSVPLVNSPGGVEETAPSRAMADAIAGATPMPRNPATTVAWTWLVPKGAFPVLGSAQPVITAIYTDLPHEPVTQFVPLLIRLSPAGPDWLLAAVARGRADASVRAETDWSYDGAEESVVRSAILQASAPGIMKLRLTEPLTPGDYAVVLRPNTPRTFSGLHVFAGPAFDADEAVVFGSVWPFHIS